MREGAAAGPGPFALAAAFGLGVALGVAVAGGVALDGESDDEWQAVKRRGRAKRSRARFIS
jgi:hypothetical protein